MEELEEKPLLSDELVYGFGRYLGKETTSTIDSHQGWVSLYTDIATFKVSKYPASHPLQALRVAQLTEVFVAIELAAPLPAPSKEDREVWEAIWKSAQAFMIFYESIPFDCKVVDRNMEDSMARLLADVISFVPRAVRRKALVSTHLLSGIAFARAIEDEMHNMTVVERNAFEGIWSIADRIQVNGACW